jgi:hypothetical protein
MKKFIYIIHFLPFAIFIGCGQSSSSTSQSDQNAFKQSLIRNQDSLDSLRDVGMKI